MENIVIFIDSLSTLQALNSSDPDHRIEGLHSSLAKLTAQFSASLQWKPAYVGLTRQTKEQADWQKSGVRLRRHRTLSPTERPGHFSIPSSVETGRKKTVDTRHTLTHIYRLELGQQTTIFRPRTGHCGLSAHQKRIGISDSSLCECGQADQTPDHVLQSCSKYAERRELTWPHGADLATKLWGSAVDLYRTAGFVVSTGLKIWPARLSIAEEEVFVVLGFVVVVVLFSRVSQYSLPASKVERFVYHSSSWWKIFVS